VGLTSNLNLLKLLMREIDRLLVMAALSMPDVADRLGKVIFKTRPLKHVRYRTLRDGLDPVQIFVICLNLGLAYMK